MRFITWATDPWGKHVPTHAAWDLIWAAVIAALAFMIVHALYVAVVAGPKVFKKIELPKSKEATIPERVPRHSLAARLFHWVMAAAMFTLLFTAFPAQGGRAIQLGTLPLDCGRGADCLHRLPHRPFIFHGPMVDMAR